MSKPITPRWKDDPTGYSKEWQKRNPEKVKAYRAKRKHQDYARVRGWISENPARHRENQRRYRLRHKERLAAKAKAAQPKKREQYAAGGFRKYHRRGWELDIKKKYGMTVEEVAWLALSQGFRCVGCQEPLRFDKATHIDHDHSTKKVRGLLCHVCNHALGWARDSVERLEALAAYLRKARS